LPQGRYLVARSFQEALSWNCVRSLVSLLRAGLTSIPPRLLLFFGSVRNRNSAACVYVLLVPFGSPLPPFSLFFEDGASTFFFSFLPSSIHDKRNRLLLPFPRGKFGRNRILLADPLLSSPVVQRAVVSISSSAERCEGLSLFFLLDSVGKGARCLLLSFFPFLFPYFYPTWPRDTTIQIRSSFFFLDEDSTSLFPHASCTSPRHEVSLPSLLSCVFLEGHQQVQGNPPSLSSLGP